MEDRIHKDEYQSAIGNVLAEKHIVDEKFRLAQIDRQTYLQRLTALRMAARRFQGEYRRAWNIMAAPTTR